jgi:hypothetical protein
MTIESLAKSPRFSSLHRCNENDSHSRKEYASMTTRLGPKVGNDLCGRQKHPHGGLPRSFKRKQTVGVGGKLPAIDKRTIT